MIPYVLRMGCSDFDLTNRISGQHDAANAPARKHVVGEQDAAEAEEVGGPNFALAVSLSGYLFAVGTLLAGLFSDERGQSLGLSVDAKADDENTIDEGERFLFGLLWAGFGLCMMVIVQLVNDVAIFHAYSNAEQLARRHNVALACVEAGTYVGAGFIVSACAQAENVALAFTFFGLGLGALVGCSLLYERVTSYDDRTQLANNNAAAGLNYGLMMAAFGLLCGRAIAVSNSVWVFLVWIALGGGLILAYRKLIDLLVLPEVSLDDELELDAEEAQRGVVTNWGVGLLSGVMTVSLVQCLNTFLRDCEFEFADLPLASSYD
jgi:uncharacterized membrane protein YjfL (UPF0719 family)